MLAHAHCFARRHHLFFLIAIQTFPCSECMLRPHSLLHHHLLVPSPPPPSHTFTPLACCLCLILSAHKILARNTANHPSLLPLHTCTPLATHNRRPAPFLLPLTAAHPLSPLAPLPPCHPSWRHLPYDLNMRVFLDTSAPRMRAHCVRSSPWTSFALSRHWHTPPPFPALLARPPTQPTRQHTQCLLHCLHSHAPLITPTTRTHSTPPPVSPHISQRTERCAHAR